MNYDERKNAIYEKLEAIYDEFAGQLITNGWNNVLYGYIETCRSNLDGSGFKVFSLDNGFQMKLTDPASDSEEEPSLTYWFDNNDVTKIDSLEQLLMVFQLSE